MEFIDTHSHLYDEAFSGEEDAAIERSLQSGVTRIILPDIDTSSRESMLSLAKRHVGTAYPCLGLHPTSIKEDWEKEYEAIEEHIDKEKFWAIGEIGLDCYWSTDFLEQQKTLFKEQLYLAHRLNLPVIIHSRESTELIINILKELKHLELRGVFHSFSGSLETFRELQKLGDWYVGIGGVITYKKAHIAETIKEIPLERILLETDSPYLTPVPFRGKRNESSYIPYIAEKVAAQKEIDIAEIAETTTSNARDLFGI